MASRRDFFASLGGLIKKEGTKEAFAPFAPFFDSSKIQYCQNCDAKSCFSSCPEGVIKISKDGVPRLDFSSRGCTFCQECATSCEFGVFSTENKKSIKAIISIDEASCMAWHNTICKSCFDPCTDKAIDFLGLFYPSINPQKCTACGFCVGVCPANAITVKGA